MKGFAGKLMLALAMLATSSSQAQEAQMVGPQDVPATSHST